MPVTLHGPPRPLPAGACERADPRSRRRTGCRLLGRKPLLWVPDPHGSTCPAVGPLLSGSGCPVSRASQKAVTAGHWQRDHRSQADVDGQRSPGRLSVSRAQNHRVRPLLLMKPVLLPKEQPQSEAHGLTSSCASAAEPTPPGAPVAPALPLTGSMTLTCFSDIRDPRWGVIFYFLHLVSQS